MDEYIREAVQKFKNPIVLSHHGSFDFDELPKGK